MPAKRRGLSAGQVQVIDENCNQCKLCITLTGCLAISLSGESIAIDADQCYGCGLCAAACNREAISFEPAAREA